MHMVPFAKNKISKNTKKRKKKRKKNNSNDKHPVTTGKHQQNMDLGFGTRHSALDAWMCV